MNRAQRRKSARTPIDAKTLKRIVDDAVEETKEISFLLFKLAVAKEGINNYLNHNTILNRLHDLEASIN